jgi:uncharacterized cupin superfamily protein
MFVVVAGRATIEGARTVWTVHESVRKVYQIHPRLRPRG